MRKSKAMIRQAQMMGTLLLWFSLMGGLGVILHIGFKNNPRQRKMLIVKQLSMLLTLGTVQGDVAILPVLFQLNALLFLILGIAEYFIRDFAGPTLSLRIWLIGFVVCALLTPVMNRRH